MVAAFAAPTFLLTILVIFVGFPLRRSTIDLETLRNDEIAILQYDSREIAKTDKQSYWSAAAKWNNYYCKLHGHVFLYYTIRGTALREIVGDIPHGRRKLLADD
eukprot:gene66216-90633_t